jgi:hypothetical protein
MCPSPTWASRDLLHKLLPPRLKSLRPDQGNPCEYRAGLGENHRAGLTRQSAPSPRAEDTRLLAEITRPLAETPRLLAENATLPVEVATRRSRLSRIDPAIRDGLVGKNQSAISGAPPARSGRGLLTRQSSLPPPSRPPLRPDHRIREAPLRNKRILTGGGVTGTITGTLPYRDPRTTICHTQLDNPSFRYRSFFPFRPKATRATEAFFPSSREGFLMLSLPCSIAVHTLLRFSVDT